MRDCPTPKALTLAAAPLVGAAFALLVGLGTTPAFAVDYARVDVMGFSANGSRFAFEEYGIQDGSGFPYSNIYLFDVDRDAWLGAARSAGATSLTTRPRRRRKRRCNAPARPIAMRPGT